MCGALGRCQGSPRVPIINEVVASRFFAGRDPIGRSVVIEGEWWEVVGIVGPIFYGEVEQLTSPEIYRPMRQWSRPTVWIAARNAR